MRFVSPYIKEEWVENIKSYKYKGADNSIVYNYFASPLCNFLVEKIPTNIAFGFICNICLFFLTYHFTGFNGKDSIPRWACYTTSLLYFTYYIFDNLDGKQARRTNTSSPLGLLFDHGCDSMTTFLFSQSLASYIALEEPLYYSLIWLMTSFPFFLNTWEEYYTGELNLPIINGVSEGTIIACIVIIMTGEFGRDIWIQKISIFGEAYMLNHLLVVIFFLSGALYALISIINVLRQYRDNFVDSIENLFIFCFLVLTLFIVIIFGDSQIIKNHPKLINILYGFSFAKLVGHLQLAHISNAKFMQYRKSLLTSFLILGTNTLLSYFYGILLVDLDTLIIGILIIHIIGIF